MQPIQVKDSTTFASRSVTSLLEIVDLLDKDTDKRRGVDPYFEAARAIKSVFDHLAWVDGELDRSECEMLDNLLSASPRLNECYERAVSSEPVLEGVVKIPFLLDLAHDYDERNGTFLGHMAINSLEMIGCGIIGADGTVSLDEIVAFQRHLSSLREYLAHLPHATA